MKKITAFLMLCVLVISSVISVSAENGRVIYAGDAGEFIFEPGSEYSLTDLFADLKDVMPGDTITQKITVKNNASDKVKVKIYVRSLGAHEDSVEFLSKLKLRVKKSADNEMAYMFDAAANETAGLSDWVYLGLLYSGGEVGLDAELTVPTELGDEFQNAVGYLDWEFKIEEFPVDPDDPKPPVIGNGSHFIFNLTVMSGSLIAAVVLFVMIKKDKKKTTDTTH